MPAERNIYQRINEVRRKIEYVQKDATVQGYKAVTHDAVTAMVRDELIEKGIIIVPDQRFSESEEVGTTQKGATIIRYQAWYEISFVNIDNPEDKLVMRIESHANDQGDKAPGKAISYAVKSAILKIFNIETGENDESRMDGERKNQQLLEHVKSDLQEYIDHGDTVAVMLLSRSVGPDAWADIYNSAPDGQKTAYKKQLSEMTKQGHEILQDINKAILQDDDLSAKENIEDMTEGGKKLLAQYLGREKAERLGEMMKR